MTGAQLIPTLTREDLLTRGYFPDRVISPVNSLGLAPALADVFAYLQPMIQDFHNDPKRIPKKRSRCVNHSVPKRKHLRRLMGIPNPFHQAFLADEVANGWKDIETHCNTSTLALSAPV